MSFLSRFLSIRSRIMMMLLFVSIIASSILIYIGYTTGRNAITQGIFNQLTGIKAAKKYQLESYFENLGNIVETLGENESIAQSMREFKTAFQQLSDEELNYDCTQELHGFYDDFLDKLSANMNTKAVPELYIPQNIEACYLQYSYMVTNPHPLSQKHLLVDANDGSNYSKAHRKYHEYLTNIVLKFGFYDLFLVDLERGDIVYTSYKETDFATNLFNGPHRESNLAQFTRQLKANSDLREAQIIDFQAYRPSYGAPAGFIGIPITDGAETVGALILQLPVDEINKITTGNRHWKADGLGDSGETYLVGSDYKMRSVSRFFLEDTIGFRKALSKINVEAREIDKMYAFGSTILLQEVNTDAVRSALRFEDTTTIINDYRNVPVLSSYAPLKVKGLNWAILSELDVEEAYLPLYQFQRKVLISLCAIVLLITFLALLLAGRFVKPIEKLITGARRVSEGDTSVSVDTGTHDEFGEFSKIFNKMVSDLDKQKTLITQQTSDNQQLLHNFIPPHIAARLKAGETNIAETHRNVSLVAIDLMGFSDLTEVIGADKAIGMLNELIHVFDLAAKKHKVEKIRTVGDTYFAACGMYSPRLDHSKRVFEFAQEIHKLIVQFNTNHRTNIKLHTGIHTGEVMAGIIGDDQFSYDLWGLNVNRVFELKDLEIDDEILISEAAYQRLEMYNFELMPNVKTKRVPVIYRWVKQD